MQSCGEPRRQGSDLVVSMTCLAGNRSRRLTLLSRVSSATFGVEGYTRLRSCWHTAQAGLGLHVRCRCQALALSLVCEVQVLTMLVRPRLKVLVMFMLRLLGVGRLKSVVGYNL
jgi:hypothetical protein